MISWWLIFDHWSGEESYGTYKYLKHPIKRGSDAHARTRNRWLSAWWKCLTRRWKNRINWFRLDLQITCQVLHASIPSLHAVRFHPLILFSTFFSVSFHFSVFPELPSLFKDIIILFFNQKQMIRIYEGLKRCIIIWIMNWVTQNIHPCMFLVLALINAMSSSLKLCMHYTSFVWWLHA